jgi:hypothetical protein
MLLWVAGPQSGGDTWCAASNGPDFHKKSLKNGL